MPLSSEAPVGFGPPDETWGAGCARGVQTKEWAGGLEQPSLAGVPKFRAAPTAEGQSEMEIQQDFQGEGEQGSFHGVVTRNFSFSGLLFFLGVWSVGVLLGRARSQMLLCSWRLP